MAKQKKIGEWAFILVVLIAIIAGIGQAAGALVGYEYWISVILIILGLIIGFMNITEKETTSFLIATIALLLVGTAGLGDLPEIGPFIGPILLNIATAVAPAALIVALKAIVELAKK